MQKDILQLHNQLWEEYYKERCPNHYKTFEEFVDAIALWNRGYFDNVIIDSFTNECKYGQNESTSQYQKYVLKSWLIDIDKENPLDIEALTFEASDLFNADPKVVEDFKADLVKHNFTLDELFKFVSIWNCMNWDQKNQLDPDNKYK